MIIPTKIDVEKAHGVVRHHAHRTPVLTSQLVNSILKCQMLLKCENFQKVGAFKYRGATNAVQNLSKEKLAGGVCTHSSGNHAAALALAASVRGIPAHIVMPNNAPTIKRKAVVSYGGIITFCEPTQEARENTLKEVQEKTGATFIHPYNNFEVICGQGTASLELIEEKPDLDVVLTPVGGGGLFSGTLVYIKETNPRTKVYAGEPANADDAFRSLRDDKLYPSVNPNTIADGLRTSLCPLTFEVIKKYADGILPVSEESIIKAMRLIWERMKIIIEPSSAVPIAAVMENPHIFENKKVGIIVSGGNVDLGNLPF